MKIAYYLFLTIILTFCFCTDKNEEKEVFLKEYIEPANLISACDVKDPLNELDWLNHLINESLNKPNFVEIVWVKEYKQQDIVIINFAVSSALYHTYDCRGNIIIIEDITLYNSLTENDMIYWHLTN